MCLFLQGLMCLCSIRVRCTCCIVNVWCIFWFIYYNRPKKKQWSCLVKVIIDLMSCRCSEYYFNGNRMKLNFTSLIHVYVRTSQHLMYCYSCSRVFLFPITFAENDGNHECCNGEDGFQCHIQGWGKQSCMDFPLSVHHRCIFNLFDAHLALDNLFPVQILCNETIWNSSSTASWENGEGSSCLVQAGMR